MTDYSHPPVSSMKTSNAIFIPAKVHLEFGVRLTNVPAQALWGLLIRGGFSTSAADHRKQLDRRSDIVFHKFAISNLILCTESILLLLKPEQCKKREM